MSILIGNIPLVDGQQSYNLVFSQAFSAPPDSLMLTVSLPNSSGEILIANYDQSTLTDTGVTIWLSGVPSSASVGGFINYVAMGPSSGTIVSSNQQGGITVPQLFHRIARRGRTQDFTKLSMSELTDLMEAANTALQTCYNLLPVYFKEMTEGFYLRAPRAITNVGVTQFSKQVTASSFLAAELGSTIRLDGDDQWNQVTGTSTLLNPYMGTTGTVNGTVYGDSIFSDEYPLDRIIGNPKFPNQGGYPLGPLTMLQGYGQAGWLYEQSIGVPRTWWVQTYGNSQGNSPFIVIKFAPLPDQAYPVNVRMGFWPKRLTIADYHNGSTLVVPSQFIEPALIPLSIEAFASTPSWDRDNDANIAFQNARRAEAYLRGQPGQVGAPSNRIFTPIGF